MPNSPNTVSSEKLAAVSANPTLGLCPCALSGPNGTPLPHNGRGIRPAEGLAGKHPKRTQLRPSGAGLPAGVLPRLPKKRRTNPISPVPPPVLPAVFLLPSTLDETSPFPIPNRSEEHTSELQSLRH